MYWRREPPKLSNRTLVAARRFPPAYRLYVCVVLPLAEESYVGNEASADASCYFREFRCLGRDEPVVVSSSSVESSK